MKTFLHTSLKMIPIIMGIIFFVSCKNDIQAVKKITSIAKYPTLQAESLTVLRSDSGYITLELKTPLVQQYSAAKEPYTEFPKGIDAKFMDKDQNITTHITADYAIYKEKENKWIARYDVEIIDKEGRIINSEYMVFDEKKGKIHSDQFTKFTETDAVIYGKGFESDLNLTNARVLEPTGFIYINEEEYETED